MAGVIVDYLEAAVDNGVLAPFDAEILVGGVVGGLEGVFPLELPGEGEVPGVLGHVLAGFQHSPPQLPVCVDVLDLAGARSAEGVADGDLVGEIKGNGTIEGRPVVPRRVGEGQIHRILHQPDRIHELEPNI